MKCEICGKRTAELTVKQDLGAGPSELRVCHVCGSLYDLGPEAGGDRLHRGDDESISGLLDGLLRVPRSRRRSHRPAACPKCGTSWSDVRETQRVGCSECYTVFDRDIRASIKRRQERALHIGRIPSRLAAFKAVLVDVGRLKKHLKDALRNEDYERAAELRDRIHEIESKDD